MKTNNKKPSALKLWLLRVIPTALIGTLTMAASCGKEPLPTPPTPAPDPVEPTKVITMDWDSFSGVWDQINSDTIAYYAAQPDVKNIVLFFDKDVVNNNPESSNYGHTSAAVSSGWRTKAFHRARDTLQTRFDISPKVIGSGTIIVHSEGGAQQPSVTEGTGMALEDSIWYASKGFAIKRFDASTMKKSK